MKKSMLSASIMVAMMSEFNICAKEGELHEQVSGVEDDIGKTENPQEPESSFEPESDTEDILLNEDNISSVEYDKGKKETLTSRVKSKNMKGTPGISGQNVDNSAENNMVKKKKKQAKPESSVTEPESSVTEPESSITEPESSTTEPESGVKSKNVKENPGISSFLDKQKRIVEASDVKRFLPVNTLHQITQKKLCVTLDTLKDFETNPGGAIVRIDLFDGVNLFIIMRDFITNILKDNTKTGQEITAQIKNSRTALRLLKKLEKSMSELISFGYICFENEDFSSIYNETLNFFREIALLIEEKHIGKGIDYFTEFFALGIKLIVLPQIRYNTEKIFSETKAALESSISGKTASSSMGASLSVPLSMPWLSAGLGQTFSEKWGTSASSFMTFTRSSNTNGGFTVGIDLGEAAKAKFGAKGNVTLTYDQIFYSLQGIIDYLIANGGSLPLSKQLDGVISDKKNLQEKEKEIQKLTKAFVSQIMTQRIIPTNVVVRLTDITKSTSTIQANEVALSANVNAAIAGGGAGADLAFEVLKSKKLYVKSFPVLYLINNDCSINNDMSLGEVVKIVGEKFYNTKIYNKKEAVASDMKILLMDLISYVIVLDNLAKDDLSKSDRETLTIKKHNIEDHWLPPKTFGSYGRDGMLRSFMLMAIYLSHMNKDNKDYDIIRRKIYEQLCTLAKFMYLSKNEKGVRKAVGYGGHDTVTGCAEADITSGQFTLNMTLPFVGTSSVTLTKQTVKGSPFIQENGEFLVIKITLPISLNGTIITKILKIVCGELIKRAKKNSKLEEFTEISNMLLWNVGGIATRLISETLQQKSKIAKVIGIGMSASMDIKIAFYKSIIEDYSAIKPLPRKGNKVVKKGGAKSPEKKNVLKKKKMVKKISKWIPDYIAISNNKTFAMELSHSFAGASVGLKSNISRGETIKVSLSLHDILSKYNALSLGLGDDKTGKNAAVKFIEGKSNALCKILKPLGKENPDGNTLGEEPDGSTLGEEPDGSTLGEEEPDGSTLGEEEPDGSTLSNVEIEMTKMYNEILSTPLTQKEKKDCDDKFIKFLTVCKELSKNDTPTEKTLSSSAATTNNPFAGISGGAANTSTEEVNDHTGEAPSEVSTAEGEEVTNTSAEEVNDHTGEAPSEVSTAEGEEVTNPSAEEVNDHIGEAAENNTEAPPYPIVINNILPILYLYHGGVFFQQYNGAFQISGQ